MVNTDDNLARAYELVMRPLRASRRLLRRAMRWVAPPVVLCAEDDESLRVLYTSALDRAGFITEVATNGREALQKIEKYYYSAILLDLGMPYLHGSTVLALMQRKDPDLLRRLVIVTGASDAVLADVTATVSSVLRKPVRLDNLVDAVRTCVES